MLQEEGGIWPRLPGLFLSWLQGQGEKLVCQLPPLHRW